MKDRQSVWLPVFLCLGFVVNDPPLSLASQLPQVLRCCLAAAFERINKRRNNFDRAVVEHVGRRLWQRLRAADHVQGGPVQISVARAAHQFERQHITFAINHEAQTIQAFFAPRLRTLRVLLVLLQMREQGTLPTGLGCQLSRRRTWCRLGGFLRWRLSRLSIGRFLLGRFFLRRLGQLFSRPASAVSAWASAWVSVPRFPLLVLQPVSESAILPPEPVAAAV